MGRWELLATCDRFLRCIPRSCTWRADHSSRWSHLREVFRCSFRERARQARCSCMSRTCSWRRGKPLPANISCRSPTASPASSSSVTPVGPWKWASLKRLPSQDSLTGGSEQKPHIGEMWGNPGKWRWSSETPCMEESRRHFGYQFCLGRGCGRHENNLGFGQVLRVSGVGSALALDVGYGKHFEKTIWGGCRCGKH